GVRRLGELFPLRYRARTGSIVHACRLIGEEDGSGWAWIDAACGGINPPYVRADAARATYAAKWDADCSRCAKRIARPMRRSEILVADLKAAVASSTHTIS